MKLPHLTTEEQQQFENGVAQVNGQSMNWTALGIVAAFLKLYPKTTFAELKEAFPDSINPSGPRAPKTIFKPYSERNFGVVHSEAEIISEFEKAGLPLSGVFFQKEDEKFVTADGVKVIVNRLWETNDTETGNSDLQQLVNHVVKYGIVVNKFEARNPFNRGSYSIDILNPALFNKISNGLPEIKPNVQEKIVEKKVIPVWVWILLALLGLAILLWFLGFFKQEPQVIEKEKIVVQTDTIVKEVTKTDTVFIEQIQALESQFNSVQFKAGSADIPEAAKYALYDLAKIFDKNPALNIKVEGHTSKEGDANFNKKLSENRAKSVVDFLVSKGVSIERLSFEGFGSSKPIDTENLDKNRRTEFTIIEK